MNVSPRHTINPAARTRVEMASPPPFLDDGTVRAHLPWRPLVDAVERSMADYSRRDGSVAQPVRSSFFLPQGNQ